MLSSGARRVARDASVVFLLAVAYSSFRVVTGHGPWSRWIPAILLVTAGAASTGRACWAARRKGRTEHGTWSP